ncbi:MAG: phosphatidylinositol phosphate synthase [Actinomycetota bacterium]
MIANRFKAPVTVLITPLCKFLLRIGVTPNALTIVGALGGVVAALIFFPSGNFFVGTLVVAAFALSDLFDGTMARISERGSTKWGALIDSTLDRLTDAAICAGILIHFYQKGESTFTVILSLVVLITGSLIPYIRARAESLGIDCSVGIAERAERLIVLLVATGLYGLGIQPAIDVGLALLSVLGVITIAQRLRVVARS